MLIPGAHVITHAGLQGLVVRPVTSNSPYLYLVSMFDGRNLILSDDGLRLYDHVARWLAISAPWNGAERRRRERRAGYSRRSDDPAPPTAELSAAERRREERRWIVPAAAGHPPA